MCRIQLLAQLSAESSGDECWVASDGNSLKTQSPLSLAKYIALAADQNGHLVLVQWEALVCVSSRVIAPGLRAAPCPVEGLGQPRCVVIYLVSPGADLRVVEIAQYVSAPLGLREVDGDVVDGEGAGDVEMLEVVDSLQDLVAVGPRDASGCGELVV